MTVHWTFVLYSLYLEVAFATLLMIPGVSTIFARLVSFLQRTLLRHPAAVLLKWIVWMFFVALLLESLRQVRAAAFF